MNIEKIISGVQSALGVDIDGRAGPATWAAIYGRIVSTNALPDEITAAPADDRSEKNIATLMPSVQPFARALVLKAAQNGIEIKIISGRRSYEEQDALFAQGRTATGDVVTHAQAGYSNHNFGIAFDIGVFEGKRYLTESPKYKAVGSLGRELGLEWGGNWKTIKDEPHFQLRPTWAAQLNEHDMLAQLRDRVAHDEQIFA